ncbi:hypothetical protein [Streptomyces sp. x-80]
MVRRPAVMVVAGLRLVDRGDDEPADERAFLNWSPVVPVVPMAM